MRRLLICCWLSLAYGFAPATVGGGRTALVRGHHRPACRILCKADLEEPGDDDVIARVMADFAGKGVDVTENAARAKLAECWKSVVDAEG